MATATRGSVRVMQILSAIVLLAVGGIHLSLVIFAGVGGTLGVLFVLNAVAAVVLLIGMLVARGRLLPLVTLLGLLFVIVTLLALILALTVGLFGITESWGFTLVPETVVVEAIGIVVLLIATIVIFRARRVAR